MKKFTMISLRQQYLIVFIVIVLVLFLFTGIFSLFFQNTLIEEVDTSNYAALRVIQTSLDSKFNDLNQTAQALVTDADLTVTAMHKNPFRTISRINQLTSLQDCLENIMIFSQTDSTIYSGAGSYSYYDLRLLAYMRNFIGAGHSREELLSLVDKCTASIYWPAYNFNTMPNYLCFIAPMYRFPPNVASVYASSRVAIFLIRQKYVCDLFAASQTTSDENILLLNEDMEVLSRLTPTASDVQIQQLCHELKSDTAPSFLAITLEGKPCLAYIAHSPENGLYYVRFLSREVAYAPVYTLRTYIILLLLVAILVSIILIYFGMCQTYQPIRALVDWVNNNNKNSVSNCVNNELLYLQHIFEASFAENSKLCDTLDNSKRELIDHFLTRMIQGTFSTKEDFREACENLGISLDRPYFCVCCVVIEEADENHSDTTFDIIMDTLRQAMPEDVFLLGKNLLFSNKLLLVLNGNEFDPAYYQNVLENCKSLMLQKNRLTTTIGMGSVCNSYDSVGKSYLDSTNASDYKLIYGKNCLITPAMYANAQNGLYPAREIERLQYALDSHNHKLSIEIIQSLREFIKTNQCSLHTAKYVCYDCFSIFKHIPTSAGAATVRSLSDNLDIMRLTDFVTIDGFFNSLIDQLSVLPTVEETSSCFIADIQQVLACIDAHCFSYDFQRGNVAEHFNISPQYLRKYFQAHMGISLSDYIDKRKLEKAMQLLRETDLDLKEIVAEVGNVDTSGFIRFFKKYTGLTPGQYRKMQTGQSTLLSEDRLPSKL